MRKARYVAVFIALHLLVTTLVVAPGAAQGAPRVPEDVAAAIQESKQPATYIVQMIGDPVAAYEGGVAGIPATKPGKGQKINPKASNVRQYAAHLRREHDRVLNAVGARGAKFYDYVYSYNGFAATLTPTQAEQIAAMPDVVAVSPEEVRHIQTDASPDFLGLTGPAGEGFWETYGKGEGVIIGVLDTGIWPEHPSFSDDLDGDRVSDYGPPPADWHGDCISGERFSQRHCNDKLIGAEFYRLGAGRGTAEINPDEYLSTRDRDGHGTHTASTAAGNEGVAASIFGIERGTVSGIAPRARIASYKVCWNDAGCFLSDILRAIDEAVADGVDVINYSIGGGASLLGADDIAFLNAAAAGVFVATSAGNEGPGAFTVGGPASVPWITAVGASTHDRFFEGFAELGDGSSFRGASITTGTGVLPLVDSEDAGSELCLVGELDPTVVAGKIVLCARGVTARVEKSEAVFKAGGAGMMLYNEDDTQDVVTDNHWVPSVHVSFSDGQAIKAYIDAEGANATAQIIGGEAVLQDAPNMAAFSSRGPNPVAPDIIKPDITAPGVSILAGNGENPYLGAPDQLFQAISGTSMSSPHVAGVAALIIEQHPDWTPAMVKSALMTTAYQDVGKEGGLGPADPFDMGAGHVNPLAAVDPGLVYDAGVLDYIAFLCPTGAVNPNTCNTLANLGFSFDASDLNLASIGIAELAGFQTVTRTVTDVTGNGGTYNVTIDAPPGIDVAVAPSTLVVPANGSASYEVTFTTLAGAAIGEWAFGSLTWSDGAGHEVRSPIAVKPVGLAAPDEVSGEGQEGSLSYDVIFGYDGDFIAEPHGLIPADTHDDTVVDDPANDINVALQTGVGVTVHQISVLAGTEYWRVSLFDDYTDGADDLDLYVFDADGNFIGGSGTPTSEEEVNFVDPVAGDYTVVVHGWQTEGPDAGYTLFSWALGAADAGNMTVTAPPTATIGGAGTITVDWSGLDAGTRYLGSVVYRSGVSAPFDFTIVRIDTD